MEIYSKNYFFFLFYFIQLFRVYVKGFILTKSLFILVINKLNLLFLISFLKLNLLSNFSSLLDIVVVDHVNLNKNRFELTYIFWNISYAQRFGVKLYTTQFSGISSIYFYYKNAN